MYLARVKVVLKEDRSEFKPDQWHLLFMQNEKVCRWRYRKNREIDFILGPYKTRYIAMHEGKRLFVNVHYNSFRNLIGFDTSSASYLPTFDNAAAYTFEEYLEQEEFYFWTKKYYTNFPGLAVFEITQSLDEYDLYYDKYIRAVLYPNSDYQYEDDLTEPEQSREALNVLSIENENHDLVHTIPLLCQAIEWMAETELISDESAGIISALKRLIQKSNLRRIEEEELEAFLNSRKKEAIRAHSLKMISKYCRKNYDLYAPKKVFEDSCDLNQKILNGEPWVIRDYLAANFLSYLFLDVFNAKMPNF